MLGPRAAPVLRARRHRGQRSARQASGGDLADRARGGQAHRRAVRYRARHQRPQRRRATAGAPGANRAAVMATLIMTAKLNDIDPQAWLADVLARIAAHPAHRLDDLLPWNWRPPLQLAA